MSCRTVVLRVRTEGCHYRRVVVVTSGTNECHCCRNIPRLQLMPSVCTQAPEGSQCCSGACVVALLWYAVETAPATLQSYHLWELGWSWASAWGPRVGDQHQHLICLYQDRQAGRHRFLKMSLSRPSVLFFGVATDEVFAGCTLQCCRCGTAQLCRYGLRQLSSAWWVWVNAKATNLDTTIWHGRCEGRCTSCVFKSVQKLSRPLSAAVGISIQRWIQCTTRASSFSKKAT